MMSEKRIKYFTLFCFVIITWELPNAHHPSIDFQKLEGPYLGQKAPALTLVVFAPGVVSVKGSDEYGVAVNDNWTELTGSHPAIFPKGSYIVFSKRQEDGFGGNDLYVTFKNGDNHWSVPINLGEGVNTRHVESSPTISLDGRFLSTESRYMVDWHASH